MASGFGGCLKSEGFSGYVFSQASLWKLLPPLGQAKQIKTKKQKQKQKRAENQSRQNAPREGSTTAVVTTAPFLPLHCGFSAMCHTGQPTPLHVTQIAQDLTRKYAQFRSMMGPTSHHSGSSRKGQGTTSLIQGLFLLVGSSSRP